MSGPRGQRFSRGCQTVGEPDCVGDQIQFKVYVPAAGSYDVSARVKTYKTRGVCQPSINGAAVGQPRDQYSAMSATASTGLSVPR